MTVNIFKSHDRHIKNKDNLVPSQLLRKKIPKQNI